MAEDEDDCEPKPDSDTIKCLDLAIANRMSEWRNKGVDIEMMDNFDRSFDVGDFFGYIVNNNSTTVQLQQSKQQFSICNETVENNADTTSDVKKTKLTVTLEEFAFSSSSSSSQSSIIDTIIKHPFFIQSSAIRRDQHNLLSPLLSTCAYKFKRKVPPLTLQKMPMKDPFPALDDESIFKKPLLPPPIKYAIKSMELNDKASMAAAKSIPDRKLAEQATVRVKRLPDYLFDMVSFGQISLGKCVKFGVIPITHESKCSADKSSNTKKIRNVTDNKPKSKPPAIGQPDVEHVSTMKTVKFAEPAIDGRGKIYPKTPKKHKIKTKSRSKTGGDNVKQLIGDFTKLHIKAASDNHSVESVSVDKANRPKEIPPKPIQSAGSCSTAAMSREIDDREAFYTASHSEKSSSSKSRGGINVQRDDKLAKYVLDSEKSKEKSSLATDGEIKKSAMAFGKSPKLRVRLKKMIPCDILTLTTTTTEQSMPRRQRDNIKVMENSSDLEKSRSAQQKINTPLTNGNIPITTLNGLPESNSSDKRQATKSKANSKLKSSQNNSGETNSEENRQHSPSIDELKLVTKHLIELEKRETKKKTTSNPVGKTKKQKTSNSSPRQDAQQLGKCSFTVLFFTSRLILKNVEEILVLSKKICLLIIFNSYCWPFKHLSV